jgi:hypothetical protein
MGVSICHGGGLGRVTAKARALRIGVLLYVVSAVVGVELLGVWSEQHPM